MGNKIWDKILEIYDREYKKLLIIPLIIIILALGIISYTYITTGDFVNKGVSLKGGSTITINKKIDALGLEMELKEKFPKADITVRSLTAAGRETGVAIDSDAQESGEIKALTEVLEKKLSLSKEEYGVEIVGGSLGSSFFKQTIVALLIAFLLMGMVVFLNFRILIPSLAVMLAASSDIIVTLAVFNLTGMKLGTGGIAAFLMLVGYSVDTDILLTSRVLKQKEGAVMERILGAVKTGLTMTATSLAAVIVVLVLVESEVVKQIMLILLIGLVVDLVMTWIQNVGIIRIYLERRKKE